MLGDHHTTNIDLDQLVSVADRMSAIGTKRTYACALHMSAFGEGRHADAGNDSTGGTLSVTERLT